MEIHAVRSSYRMDSYYFDTLMRFLSYEEGDKIKRYQRWEDAQRYLIGKIAIKSLICNSYGLENEDIYFSVNKFGKPYVKGVKDLHFNISHSGEWVVYAIDRSSIGIDVEEINDIDLDIADRFFSKDEYSELLELNKEHRLGRFFDLWTLKESYIKAEGKGMSIPLDSFTIRKKGEVISIKGADKSYYFKQYDIAENYKLSVCAMNNNFPMDINIMELKDFRKYSINSRR
ncbi:4'-phosphopantetheinyl transferase family protein [Marinisporobacter balticus]|uniref:4'-phosphopantetheinyl transferase n=1 Tax=Marinisporobacter balticus TaxID=2018667 RepID=A0A4R2KK51_9FIRM|nr:4'-phosphopantetheinyl transferase superfamily protein [Marinisporobacter balticus]TCO70398.1 4'-phosphopantetheinyl transferase [Marinisporobacter balticus]